MVILTNSLIDLADRFKSKKILNFDLNEIL